MNTPGGISKVTHDGSREDIRLHFNEHHYHNLFEYIGCKQNGEKNTDDEIRKIMISVGQKNKEIGFEAYRKSQPRGLSYEDAGHLINTILIYNKAVKKIKDSAIMDLMDNHCTLKLPEYLKTITNEEIEEKLHTETSKKIYKFLSKKIRNVVEFFYNFRKRYEEEQRERDLEDTNKDNIYTAPKETAFDKTYKEFFKAIDPQSKFTKENEEIIRVFFEIFKTKGKEEEKKQKIQEIEVGELRTKNLQENTHPEFQEVDEDGDVIGLTKEHTPGWNIPNPPRSNDPFS